MADQKQTEQEKEMSFLEHLEELRWHIIRSLVAIVFFAIIVFIFKEFVFDRIIFAPRRENFPTYKVLCQIADFICFKPPEFQIIPREFGEKFFTHLKISFWLGLVIAFPYIFWEIWRFIRPGLYKNEQKAAKGMVLICSFLFLLGVFFGYFIISPFAIKFLAGYNISDVETISSSSLSSYVTYMTMFTIPAGIVFELPVVVYFLSRIGLLSPAFMRKYRKHSIVVILIFAAIITPPEVVTQVLIGIPVIILYEISIFISGRAYKKYHKDS